MKEKKTIILDADDVLYRCNYEALKVSEQKLGRKGDYYKIDRWGLLNDEVLDGRLACFADPEFVRNLPLYRGAKKFVQELAKKYEVLICTSVPANVCEARFASLMEHFPELSAGNIIFGSRKDKLTAFASLDDNPDNYKIGGGVKYPVIFTQPWNLNGCSGRLRVNSYEGFLTLLEELESVAERTNPRGLVLVGPSGANKNLVAAQLESLGFERIRSYSTRVSEDYIHVEPATFRKNAGEYIEMSSYMDDQYGLKKADIENSLAAGHRPLLILDINGAVSVGSRYNFASVYVKETKENCIRNILSKPGIRKEEAIKRLVSLEDEMLNERLCDEVLDVELGREEVLRISQIVMGPHRRARL